MTSIIGLVMVDPEKSTDMPLVIDSQLLYAHQYSIIERSTRLTISLDSSVRGPLPDKFREEFGIGLSFVLSSSALCYGKGIIASYILFPQNIGIEEETAALPLWEMRRLFEVPRRLNTRELPYADVGKYYTALPEEVKVEIRDSIHCHLAEILTDKDRHSMELLVMNQNGEESPILRIMSKVDSDLVIHLAKLVPISKVSNGSQGVFVSLLKAFRISQTQYRG
ncbi:MAG TPA: hypothetical protein ENI23_07145 [bacterium]|nr:hypothetical protein [bacterium]